MQMVHGIRGVKLLQGYRGTPPGDIAKVEETLLRVSQLVGECRNIAEMDLNPLKVLPVGRGCVVLDARVFVKRP
jgi:acetyltransferase